MNNIKTLVENAKNGDKQAFEELYSLTNRNVYFICLKFLKNEEDAKDIFQDTYVTASKKLQDLIEPEKFEPWIKRIAINKCKNFLKSSAVVLRSDMENIEEDITDEDLLLPESFIIQKEKRNIILNIIDNSLSDIQRQTIMLYYFNEMTIEEIASFMDCPVITATYVALTIHHYAIATEFCLKAFQRVAFPTLHLEVGRTMPYRKQLKIN